MPDVQGVRVEQVDPATLLVDVNVRTATVADKDFVASLAKTATVGYDLTIDQAAGIAEFEDDAET